jgi:hypothetical protein
MDSNYSKRSQVKLNTLRQVKELVQDHMQKVEPVMDDYDGGQKAAFIKVLESVRAYEAIIKHTELYNQQEPGMDY